MNYFQTYDEKNTQHFEIFIKTFLKANLNKKLKRYFNTISIQNCKPKFNKIVEFMNKYSISDSNFLENNNINLDSGINDTLDDITTKKDVSVVHSTPCLSITNPKRDSIINFEKIYESNKEKSFDIKLPFKVIHANEKKNLNKNKEKILNSVNNNENSSFINNNCNNLMFNFKFCDFENTNLNKDKTRYFASDLFESNFNNFINVLSNQNKFISSLGNKFHQIYKMLENEGRFEKEDK